MFYKIYEIIYSEILLNKITSPLDVEYIPNCKCEIHVFYKNGEMQAPPLSYVFYSGKQSQD